MCGPGRPRGGYDARYEEFHNDGYFGTAPAPVDTDSEADEGYGGHYGGDARGYDGIASRGRGSRPVMQDIQGIGRRGLPMPSGGRLTATSRHYNGMSGAMSSERGTGPGYSGAGGGGYRFGRPDNEEVEYFVHETDSETSDYDEQLLTRQGPREHDHRHAHRGHGLAHTGGPPLSRRGVMNYGQGVFDPDNCFPPRRGAVDYGIADIRGRYNVTDEVAPPPSHRRMPDFGLYAGQEFSGDDNYAAPWRAREEFSGYGSHDSDGGNSDSDLSEHHGVNGGRAPRGRNGVPRVRRH